MITMELQVGVLSMETSCYFSFLPIGTMLILCLSGFIMAYFQKIPAHGRKLLNEMVFCLFLPCLIFTQLGRAINLENMFNWWFIPVNVVLGSAIGSIIGYIVASLVPPPPQYFRFMVVHIGIGNIGNIPLVLLTALCNDPANPFGGTDKCRVGNAYISFGQWVGAIILYSYVFKMLTPPTEGWSLNDEGFVDNEENILPISYTVVNNDNKPDRTPLLNTTDQEVLQMNYNRTIYGILLYLLEKIKPVLKPPIVAALLAIIFGITPFLKNLVLRDDAPLFFVTNSLMLIGGATIPCILVSLGGNLIDGPGIGTTRLRTRTMVAIVFTRLMVVPISGLGVVALADKLGFLPKMDKMFKFVLLLQHSMPTSVLSGAVANLQGCGRESAAVLFYVHICAVISMPFWIGLFFHYLF